MPREDGRTALVEVTFCMAAGRQLVDGVRNRLGGHSASSCLKPSVKGASVGPKVGLKAC